jgi:tetratricopeptide (TPR) repeat protein
MAGLWSGDTLRGGLCRAVPAPDLDKFPTQKFDDVKKFSPYSILILIAATCFTLGTLFVPRAETWNGNSQSDDDIQLFLGEGRRMFANQFFVMGDVYFHSGYYPSIFDEHETNLDVVAPSQGQAEDSDSTSDDFMGKPKDWIDAFGRNFSPNAHTHLDSGGATGHLKPAGIQEILPWLKLASDMNPQMIETYTVGAYWLRHSLHNPKEAEAFLRDGLRHNPGNYQLLFDLGDLYNENYHDTNSARNVWVAALSRWQLQTNVDKIDGDKIVSQLAHLEENSGNLQTAIRYLEKAKTLSPDPSAVQKQIDGLKQKLADQSSSTNRVTP